MPSIPAIYENGVFRPTQPVALPEGTHVLVQPAVLAQPKTASREQVFDILSRSYETGDPHAAQKHNEHRL